MVSQIAQVSHWRICRFIVARDMLLKLILYGCVYNIEEFSWIHFWTRIAFHQNTLLYSGLKAIFSQYKDVPKDVPKDVSNDVQDTI